MAANPFDSICSVRCAFVIHSNPLHVQNHPCNEKPLDPICLTIQKFNLNLSHYKYLLEFVVLDSTCPDNNNEMRLFQVYIIRQAIC